MKPLYGTSVEKTIIREEKSRGIRMSETVCAEHFLIHTYFFKTRYIAYEQIRRMYMRVAGGEFGEFPIDEYSLVIIDASQTEHALHMERGEYVKGVLDWIREHHPMIAIGKE